MTFMFNLARRHAAIRSTVRLWLVFVAYALAVALLIAALQRADGVGARPATASPPTPAAHGATSWPRTAFTATFEDAAGSLRAGHWAEAYGRFVALAEEGDVNAGRIALVMHRFGPEIFGSAWDASGQQLAQWTEWSEAAARRELAESVGRGKVVPEAGWKGEEVILGATVGGR